jgi:hypothetical protein
VKEVFNKDKESLIKEKRKKKQMKTLEIKTFSHERKNTVESHSSRLEQVEDRI